MRLALSVSFYSCVVWNWFYPYPSGLFYWPWSNPTIIPGSVQQSWNVVKKIRTNPHENHHDKTTPRSYHMGYTIIAYNIFHQLKFICHKHKRLSSENEKLAVSNCITMSNRESIIFHYIYYMKLEESHGALFRKSEKKTIPSMSKKYK